MCVFYLFLQFGFRLVSLEIKQSHGTETKANSKKTYELNVNFQSDKQLVATIKSGRKRAKRFKIKDENVETVLAKFETELKEWLGNRKVEIGQALIKPSKKVIYENLVKALDILRSQNITNLGVLAGDGR